MNILDGLGRKERIIVNESLPSKIDERGTGFSPQETRTTRTLAVVSQRTVMRNDDEAGGARQKTEYEFYIPEGIVEHPFELGQHPVTVLYRGQEFIVQEVRDWVGSHQVLKADLAAALV